MTSPRATTTDVPVGRLVARTVEVVAPETLPASLLDLLPSDEPMAWLRRGEGMVAWGVAARCRTSGPDRFADAADWWQQVSGSAVVRDEVQAPGTGLISFGSFGFADDPGDSVLVVPRVVVGTRRGRSWVTVIGQDELAAHARPRPPGRTSRAAQRDLRRRRDERHRLGVRGRRRGRTDRLG